MLDFLGFPFGFVVGFLIIALIDRLFPKPFETITTSQPPVSESYTSALASVQIVDMTTTNNDSSPFSASFFDDLEVGLKKLKEWEEQIGG